MSVPIEIREIHGAAELHDWFGYWPNFHDAEIINLHLNRTGSSSLRVHTLGGSVRNSPIRLEPASDAAFVLVPGGGVEPPRGVNLGGF